MHLPVRETRTLDDAELARDLSHGPADIVVLSFSDTDLALFAKAWDDLPGPRPVLRLANAGQLRHAMSVDLYVEDTIRHSRCVIVRLIGGFDFWRYGVEQISACCRNHHIPLAILSGATGDERLEEHSTMSAGQIRALDDYMSESGPENAASALRLVLQISGMPGDPPQLVKQMPLYGVHDFDPGNERSPDAAIVFYRSHLVAGDIAPVEALAEQLTQRGISARGLFINSLKDPAAAAFVSATLSAWQPSVVLTTTGFSARLNDRAGSPLDSAGCPILQLAMSGGQRETWRTSSRGLSASDLAMLVALPEVDGRLSTTAISFKGQKSFNAELRFAHTIHEPDMAQIALAVDRAAGWVRLARTARKDRKVAIVLSDYPAIGGQTGHAVGLDTFASLKVIAATLAAAGYACDAFDDLNPLARKAAGHISLDQYTNAAAGLLPRAASAWGPPPQDTAVTNDSFSFPIARSGNLVAAIQPDRGSKPDRVAAYHDADATPRHGYLAFYIWLTQIEKVDAVIHLGAHGTLEWLPGKANAPAADDFSTAILGSVPTIYPFIVNNPGEALPAKRRLGAVMIGHLTPPLKLAGAHGQLAELEHKLEEYAAAETMDRRRADALKREIMDAALGSGIAGEAGVTSTSDIPKALSRIDAYLCDVKELRIRDGLHVFGHLSDAARETLRLSMADAEQNPDIDDALVLSPERELQALLNALDGKFVEPGPAGAPTRTRFDVLPTGRNVHGVDPRTVPTRTAMRLAEKTAQAVLLRHLQDNGDHLRTMLFDIWGGPTLRTGGEDLALAFWLMGVKPVWDHASARVTGIEIVPMAKLLRPRVDVTLRVSGLFRDAFNAQIELFDLAVRTLVHQRETLEDNALVATAGLQGEAFRRATIRIYGSPPGDYGSGVTGLITSGAWNDTDELGAAWLRSSSYTYGSGLDGAPDPEGLKARVGSAQAMLHVQDHAEIDILDSLDFPAHEGGFAAAATSLGGTPSLYHADTSDIGLARIRPVAQEVARITRGRAGNPVWLAGMMRHGYRGGAEIARSVDGLFAFAATLPHRFDKQFDLLFEATLGSAEVANFIRTNNLAAFTAMASRFDEAMRRGLWRPLRNDVYELLKPSADA